MKMKLTQKQISLIEAILSDREDRLSGEAIVRKYGLSSQSHLSAFCSVLRTLGVREEIVFKKAFTGLSPQEFVMKLRAERISDV